MGYSYDYGYAVTDFFTVFAMIIPVILLLVLGIGFVFYIFDAIGVYQISKKRGYKNAWLAFIPIANAYVFGGIVDNINFCYGKKSSFRIWLLVLRIVNAFVGFFTLAPLFRFFSNMISSSYVDENYLAQMLGSTMLISSLVSLVSLAMIIITYICLFKVFSDYSPKNATMFLVLSILFSIQAFFIFGIRNNQSASLYYASQRNNQPPYQPPFNGQGGQQQYQPPYNMQNGQPPYQQPQGVPQPQFTPQNGQQPPQYQHPQDVPPPQYTPQGVQQQPQYQQPVQQQIPQNQNPYQPQPQQPMAAPLPYQRPNDAPPQENTPPTQEDNSPEK